MPRTRSSDAARDRTMHPGRHARHCCHIHVLIVYRPHDGTTAASSSCLAPRRPLPTSRSARGRSHPLLSLLLISMHKYTDLRIIIWVACISDAPFLTRIGLEFQSHLVALEVPKKFRHLQGCKSFDLVVSPVRTLCSVGYLTTVKPACKLSSEGFLPKKGTQNPPRLVSSFGDPP